MSDSEPRRILIVEDDPEIRYLLAAILEGDGRHLVPVGTGAEAEEATQEAPLDLVVLDLILPDMDGRSFLRRLREDAATSMVPVVVISARGGPDVRRDCMALGADAFVEKPFDPEQFALDVATRLERHARASGGERNDPLTGLLNRAGLLERYRAEPGEGAVALVQLDGFPALTERWGWELGELVLKRVSEALGSHVPPGAGLGRLGGGEFAFFLRGVDVGEARAISQSVLEDIRELSYADPEGETFRITASIGVVSVDADSELDEALEQAYRRLFRAKEAGRNQVVAVDDPFETATSRVLVAEDDNISATILVHRLEKEGLQVVRYDNGRDAYDGAMRETPDLVILDVKMPGMDGFEVLERLRRTPSYQQIPIIMLTSMGSEPDVVRGFQLGADDYVLKPFSPIELSARVWRLLRRGRAATAV